MDQRPAQTIVVLKGDQTGQELLEEALRVLQPTVIRLPLQFVHFDLSIENRRASKNSVIQEAADAINRASFNVGSVNFLDGNDKLHSKVYHQRPDWNEKASLYRGQKINIRLRSDEFFDFESLIERYKPDTTKVDTSRYY